ncbi:MAG TPA: DUF5666 domain-containing protein [Usitatibacter sp.]|nr:DUF5666 domain-containing protein [Usitatibacter sp.]
MKNLIWLLTVVVLAGCGQANTGSTGTGGAPPLTVPTVASGPLTSLGPLGVAGAQLTDAGTQVQLNTLYARPSSDLRLGMFADADGQVAPSTGEGVASTAVAQSVVIGPVAAIDLARRSLQVLGSPARADQNTLLENFERLDQLAVGDRVEVFGLRLPGAEGVLATRVILREPSQAVELLGTISEVGIGSFTAQGVRIAVVAGGTDFSPAPPGGPPQFAAGTLVRVRGTHDAATGVVTASLVVTGFAPVRSEGKQVYVEGFVLAQSAATRFQVGDVAVDTTDVAATPLAVGMRVRLRGRMQAGALRVDQVAVVAADARIEYVFEGPISAYASIADFRVRGERVDASSAVVLGGPASSLADGVRARVKGVAGPGRVNATEVTIVH